LVVGIKPDIKVPDWVSKFDAPAGNTQDKTWGFRTFVDNLLKGGADKGAQFAEDTLLRVPVVLYDLPVRK
jgi:hypothetical protein